MCIGNDVHVDLFINVATWLTWTNHLMVLLTRVNQQKLISSNWTKTTR